MTSRAAPVVHYAAVVSFVKVECSCGNVRYCRSADLMMVYGGGVDPMKLKFDCNRCKPDIKITLLEVHPEHLPKKLMIHNR
ncbi:MULTISPECIES: hypothetical protein [unclassified Mesorhizobium]|uniref:hypothetical protein n=1 Tax=unclassified Mesorhizobium TaxID=325217 RepID=UPI001FD91AC6|nr:MULTISPECIES: hypothetical protein [unclassified Mesorhizobium]